MHAHTAAQRPRDYCILDKTDLETRGDLHIVWRATDGWITARALMSFQPTPCTFQAGSLQIQPTPQMSDRATQGSDNKSYKRELSWCGSTPVVQMPSHIGEAAR